MTAKQRLQTSNIHHPYLVASMIPFFRRLAYQSHSILLVFLCLCVVLRGCSGLASQTVASLHKLPPTRQDEQLEEWYVQCGILGTDAVQVRTTQQSVAGRGLFYFGTEPAKQGDMLALIPSRCILTHQTAKRQWPELTMDVVQKDTGASRDDIITNDWPVLLTAYAKRALDDNTDWSQWIHAWQGPKAPCPPDSLTTRELQQLATQAQSSISEVEKALQVRYSEFDTHCRRLDSLGITNYQDLYGVVLSRAANLGPQWNYASGIIPLHDMLNHVPIGKTPSVELFTVGEIASQTSRNHVARLASKACFAETKMQDTDLILVARQNIHPGEELFLSYTKRSMLADEETRVWKMLQYGFCLQ